VVVTFAADFWTRSADPLPTLLFTENRGGDFSPSFSLGKIFLHAKPPTDRERVNSRFDQKLYLI